MNPYKQKVTYWAPGASDGYGGMVFGAPEILSARWEDRQEEYMNTESQVKVSNAIVFFLDKLYSDVIETKGYLFLGCSEVNDPTTLDGSFEIQQLMRTPDLRNVKMELRVLL